VAEVLLRVIVYLLALRLFWIMAIGFLGECLLAAIIVPK